MQLLVAERQRFMFMTFWKVTCTTVQQLWWETVTNTSFFGKMPLLINCNIFQLCVNFSQLPSKHTGFILQRLTISLVCSGSFQFSTLCLLKDLFSWVEFKNSEHLITLSLSRSLRGKEEGGKNARRGLCQLNSSSQGICFSFGVRLDVQAKRCYGAASGCLPHPERG